MTLRIRVEELGDEVRKCLERGEIVEIERDGVVVGRLEPETSAEVEDSESDDATGLKRFLALRRKHGPVDEDFARDLEQIRREMNTPIGPSRWES